MIFVSINDFNALVHNLGIINRIRPI